MRPASGTSPAFPVGGASRELPAAGAPVPIRPATVVPRPGEESTWQEPPSAASRSLMFRSPVPFVAAAGSKPGPSSAMVNATSAPSSARLTRTADPGACRTAFCSASTQQK